MAHYTIKLSAGVPYRQDTPGRIILIDSTGDADQISVTPITGSGQHKKLTGRRAQFKYVLPFDAVIFEAEVDCEIAVFLSFNDVNNGFASGGGVMVTNSSAAAVPVRNQPLTEIVDYDPVTVTSLVAVPLISDSALRRVRFRNGHPSAVVALGGEGVTLLNCPIRLMPEDVFVEEDAAGAAWYVVTDTPGAIVQIQGLK